MTPREGRVATLRLLCAEPMFLCLFTKGPVAGKDECSIQDFTPSKASQMRPMSMRDWLIDEEKVTAMADKRTFGFSSVGEKILGWYMILKKDSLVIGYDYFQDSYKINSTDDKVGARPRLMLGAIK